LRGWCVVDLADHIGEPFLRIHFFLSACLYPIDISERAEECRLMIDDVLRLGGLARTLLSNADFYNPTLLKRKSD
jgi:hypothetical protein